MNFEKRSFFVFCLQFLWYFDDSRDTCFLPSGSGYGSVWTVGTGLKKHAALSVFKRPPYFSRSLFLVPGSPLPFCTLAFSPICQIPRLRIAAIVGRFEKRILFDATFDIRSSTTKINPTYWNLLERKFYLIDRVSLIDSEFIWIGKSDDNGTVLFSFHYAACSSISYVYYVFFFFFRFWSFDVCPLMTPYDVGDFLKNCSLPLHDRHWDYYASRKYLFRADERPWATFAWSRG